MSPAAGGPGGNPYIDQVVADLEARGVTVVDFSRRRLLAAPDAIHVHWPMSLVRPRPSIAAILDCFKVLVLTAIARSRGSVLIWTAHDLAPHEGFPSRLHVAFHALFLRQVDHLIVLSRDSRSALVQRWPALARRPSTVVPHGHYKDCYPPPLSRSAARISLGVPLKPTVYLAFGQVRPYKNLLQLIKSWAASAGSEEELHIVGEVKDPALQRALVLAASDLDSVKLHFGRANESEVSLWHSAADAVVLTYADGTSLNSGAAMLGLSFGLPVLVRRSATMQEIADIVGSDWLIQCDGPDDGLTQLRQRLSRRPTAPNPQGMEHFDWEAVGGGTLDAYRAAMGDRSSAVRA